MNQKLELDIRRLTRRADRMESFLRRRFSLPMTTVSGAPAPPDEDHLFQLPDYVKGADLRFQGHLDAEQAIRHGIVVFIPKWGEGDTEVSTFKPYTEEIIRAGGLLTWYHFPTFGAKSGHMPGSYEPELDAKFEADAFLKGISKYQAPDLGLMVDVEKETIDISPGAAQSWMRAFVAVVLPHCPGGRILLYSSDRKLQQIFGHYEVNSSFYDWLVSVSELVLPRYGANVPGTTIDWAKEPIAPEPWARAGRSWVGWQFKSTYDADAGAGAQPGQVDGIEKKADMILFRTSWLRTVVPASEIAALVAREEK